MNAKKDPLYLHFTTTINSVRHCLRSLCIFCAPTVCSRYCAATYIYARDSKEQHVDRPHPIHFIASEVETHRLLYYL